jgi:hypothetical protein
VELRYAAFAASILGLMLVSNQVFAASPAPAPVSGAATCISGFTPTPTSWNSTTATSYVCKSEKPACARGTALEGNVKAISGLVNEPGQQNVGQSKSGYFFYPCGVPSKVAPPQ